MGFQPYLRKAAGRRKAVEVQAIQVTRPYRTVKFNFPRCHQHNKPGGVMDYLRLIDAPEGANRAKHGDWIVKFPDGGVEAVSAEEFKRGYVETGAAEVGVQESDSEALDSTTQK